VETGGGGIVRNHPGKLALIVFAVDGKVEVASQVGQKFVPKCTLGGLLRRRVSTRLSIPEQYNNNGLMGF